MVPPSKPDTSAAPFTKRRTCVAENPLLAMTFVGDMSTAAATSASDGGALAALAAPAPDSVSRTLNAMTTTPRVFLLPKDVSRARHHGS